jgi:hypothetical protein
MFKFREPGNRAIYITVFGNSADAGHQILICTGDAELFGYAYVPN